MDLQFNCPRCSQHLTVDAKGAGLQIECPTCKGQITIPPGTQKDARPTRRLSLPAAGSVSAEANSESEPNLTRRSEWSGFLNVMGVLCLVGGVGGCAVSSGVGEHLTAASWMILVAGIAFGLQAFFFAFLVDVFTDIRWFLKRLVDKQ